MEDSSPLFSISDKPEEEKSDNKIPIYNVDHIYDINVNDNEDDKAKKPKINRNVCWNCGEAGHAIRQCQAPYNARNVTKNRSSHAQRSEFKRYHVEFKGRLYPHLKPGIMSDNLRAALGIRNKHLPEYIYRMRTLGYPPGWLLEARTDRSGIEMFDVKGNRVPNAGEEEGEIGLSNAEYDVSKIISYPGFNSWPDKGTIDETRMYGAPDLTLMTSKDDFINGLKKFNASVNFEGKRMAKERKSTDECDMDLQELEETTPLPENYRVTFIPPLPEDAPPPPPQEALEEGEVKDEPAFDVKNSTNMESDDGNFDSCNKTMENSDDLLNMTVAFGTVKSIELGTPVLKIHSPYNKLPSPDAFRKDISDVINFENLPDSTGTYEKLKDVLKGVRNKLSALRGNKMNNTI